MKLKRVCNSDAGTFGVLIDNDIPICLTLELPYRGNQRNISCIPFGKYECKRKNSNRFGDTFEVKNVSGRTHILLHKGNTIKDTSGCILLGNSYGFLGGVPAIYDSREAFNNFMLHMRDKNKFELEIL